MKKNLYLVLGLLVIVSMLAVACGAKPTPTAPAAVSGQADTDA